MSSAVNYFMAPHNNFNLISIRQERNTMRKGIMALESIAFQGPAFFEELTSSIETVRGFGNDLEINEYYTSKPVVEILKVIKRNTNITFIMLDAGRHGAFVMPPTLSAQNVLFTQVQKSRAKQDIGENESMDVHAIMNEMSVSVISGEVSLKKAFVSGAYEKMKLILCLKRSILFSDDIFTARELAAIILHEVGHAFTYMEFIGRTVSTNQVLAGMVRAMDGTTPAEKRTLVFARGSKLLRMTQEQQAAMLNSKNAKEVAWVVLDNAIQTSVSELGASVYDVTSCEYLADEFATRHGAGRDLVTGLDKLYNHPNFEKVTAQYFYTEAISFAIMAVMGLFIGAVTFGTFWLALIFIPDKNGVTVDSKKSRFLRIKYQNTQRLKDKTISAEEKKTLIESNATISLVCSYHDDNLNFLEKAAYYLRPSYRNAHKFELLQKDLEYLASSSLFDSAAKLSLL
jgi:hypothetical protein